MVIAKSTQEKTHVMQVVRYGDQLNKNSNQDEVLKLIKKSDLNVVD